MTTQTLQIDRRDERYDRARLARRTTPQPWSGGAAARDRREGTSAVRGLLVGTAIALGAWAGLGGAVAVVMLLFAGH